MVWAVGGIYLLSLGAVLVATIQDLRSSQPRSRQQAYPELMTSGRTLYLGNRRIVLEFDQGRFDATVNNVVIQWPAEFSAGRPISELESTDETRRPAFSARHLRLLQQCRRLRNLTLHSATDLGDDELRALGDLHQLQGLSFIGCDIRPELWQQLARLPGLRYLDLSGSTLRGGCPDLEKLTRLETLVLGSPAGGGIIEIDFPVFPELHRLPGLKTLVVRDYVPMRDLSETNPKVANDRPVSSNPPTVDALNNNIEQIRAITTLQALFVNDDSPNFAGFDELQRQLPRVRVRPTYVDGDRQLAIVGLFGLNAVLLFLLAIQAQSQFSHPAAHLTPNYMGPHVLPLCGLWLFGVLVHGIPLCVRGVPFAAAVGFNLLCWGLLCGLSAGSTLMNVQSMMMRRVMICVGFTSLGWGPLAMGLLKWNRSSIDWYLRGQEPVWTWFFIISGIALSVVTMRHVLRLHSIYLERGISSPPLSLDPAARAAWHQQIPGQEASRMQPLCWRLERVIARARRPGWRLRSNLWIAGNVINGNLITLSALGIGVGLAVVANYGADWISDFLMLQHPVCVLLSILLPDILVLSVVFQWRQRRPYFAMESLRPVSRTEYAGQIGQALAWDLSPLGGVYLSILIWYAVAADPSRWSWGWTFAMLAVFIARWVAIYGLALWAITIRRDWVLVLATAIGGYSLLFINITIVFLQSPVLGVQFPSPDLPNIGVAGLAGMALGFGLLTVAVARFAYRRWKWIELV
jgi:hypothetical protein